MACKKNRGARISAWNVVSHAVGAHHMRQESKKKRPMSFLPQVQPVACADLCTKCCMRKAACSHTMHIRCANYDVYVARAPA
mmetsp:Transcript_20992/g.43790  ORF Transcript_20992/g.43790 Transcript_20992/m.43790 type:complete len:82 (+) Transcript_20992:66-311(+)